MPSWSARPDHDGGLPCARKLPQRNLILPRDVFVAGLTPLANASRRLLRGAGIRPYYGEFAMNILISLLITILVIGLVLYLVRMLPLDGAIKNVVQIIVIVIGIISLLRYLAVF